MKYADVLQECLDKVRRGGDAEPILQRYPDYAAQLRQDLAAANLAHAVSRGLDATSPAARTRFSASLQAERQVREEKAARRWFAPLRLVPAAAGLLAVVVALFVASGIVWPENAAEASVEGVVVENDGDVLTLQTEAGLRHITVADSAQVSDPAGGSVSLASLEPGQLLAIRGRQVGADELRAQRIQLREQGALPPWCEQFSESCAAVEPSIAERVSQCQRTGGEGCENLRARLAAMRAGIAARDGVRQLQQRCEAGTVAACREIQQLCQNGRPACAAIAEWLRKHPVRQR